MLTFKKVESTEIKELASLASSIWHEYWTCILSDEQIDYMVENFQSEKAIKNQIENENYTYYFIRICHPELTQNEIWTTSCHPAIDAGSINVDNKIDRFRLKGWNDEIFNDVVGYFGISDKQDYLFLSKLYIKKEFRHKGIGAKAFEKIKQIANGKKIRLTVNKYNTNTIKAYEKWGFKTVDAVVTDIGNGFVMDDYIMEYITTM